MYGWPGKWLIDRHYLFLSCEVAGDRIRAREMNAERVTLEAGVGIFNVVQLRVRTDIPARGSDNEPDKVDLQISRD